ncbi:MAG: sigma-70 family RNA polymerase sigma factor [Anaerolineales bacterium]|nr:sigma-70 family RNA polymerase sigma factor [Anaerolineales bacterium]
MINSSYASRPMEVLPEESRLVRQAKSGNADAFVQLYEAYVDRVYRYVYFRVIDDELAESLTPRVFIKAWQLLDRYHPYGSPFIIWLYKIASNQIIEHFYTHPKTVSNSDGFLWSIEDRVFDKNVKDMFDLQAVRDALRFLNDEEQQALTLKFISGVSTNEVARIMEKPVSAIQILLMYALQKVTKHMDEKELR